MAEITTSGTYGPETVSGTIATGNVTVSLDDLGSGTQIAYVATSDSRLDFAAGPMWGLRWYDGADELAEIVSTAWGDPTLEMSGEDFTLRWINPTTGTWVEIDGTVRDLYDDLFLSPPRVIPAGADEVYSAHRARVLLRPKLRGSGTGNRAMLPVVGGLYARNVTAGTTEVTMSAPGFLRLGQAGSSLSAGWLSLLSFWDHETRHGFIIRAVDPSGSPKEFTTQGSNGSDYVIVGLRSFPTNRKDRAGESYAAEYGWSIHPMIGEWWDHVVYYRWAQRHEGGLGLSRGRLSESPESYPAAARNMRIFCWGPGDESDIANITEDVTRIRDYYGTSAIVVSAYVWQADGEDPAGDFSPPNAEAQAAIAALLALGVTVGIYTYPPAIQVASTAYSANGFAASVVKDENGDVFEDAGGRAFINPLQTAAIQLNIDRHADMIAAYLVGLDAAYFDVGGGWGQLEDYNGTLTPQQRGLGSGSWQTAKRAVLDYFRTALGIDVVLAEHIGEHILSVADILSETHWLPTVPTNYYAAGATGAWGEYVRVNSYQTGGGNVFVYSSGTLGELAMWQWLFELHRGCVLSFGFNDTREGYFNTIPIDSDPDYDARSWQLDMHAALKRDWVDAWTYIAPFVSRGQRLRPIAGSFERYTEDNGYSFSAAAEDPIRILLEDRSELLLEDGTPLLNESELLAPTVASACPPLASAWYSDEGGTRAIMVRVSNYRQYAVAFTVALAATDYPWLAGTHTVYQLDTSDGSLTAVGEYENDISFSVALAAWETATFKIPNVKRIRRYDDSSHDIGSYVEPEIGGRLLLEDGNDLNLESDEPLLLEITGKAFNENRLLLEDGNELLIESGDRLLLE